MLFDPADSSVKTIVNLEYLSAEPYAAEFHRMPSLTRSPLVRKHMFMPGFEAGTGGLILDRAFMDARARCSDAAGRRETRRCLARRLRLALPDAVPGLADRFWLLVFGYERDYGRIVEDIADCFPWDGAVQFSRAMAELHGWGRVMAKDTMFGPIPPTSISVEVDPGVFEEVLWGDFGIPGIKGKLTCGIGRKDKRMIFSIRGEVIKRDLPLIRKLADLTRKLVRTNSIYRGKAIELALDDGGNINWKEQPRFLDPPVTMKDLIYSDEILDQIGTHLIAPVTKREVLKQLGRPFGGAVLISGTYGVGKTVLAAALANVCRDVDVTFISVKSLVAVQDALIAARPLGPAVVFVEDIDRISADAERNERTQEIMNTIASVSSKGAEVMAVFTTNRPGAIAPGLVQRFNGVIVIHPPKPPEVERLIRLYGVDLIEADEDLTEAAQHLSGKVPRTIEQIVQASKQYAVHRNNVDDVRQIRIIGRDIIGAAIQKEFQLELESRGDERVLTPAEKMGKAMEELLGVNKIQAMLSDICSHLDL